MHPLDRFVFGAMKTDGRRIYRSDVAAFEPISRQMAAAFLIRAWEAVSIAVLGDAWATDEDMENENE
jgi:hypothetical protein